MKYDVPLNERYLLSVEEACAYFGIGDKTMRRFLKEHEHESFILHVGEGRGNIKFKRRLFEEYLDRYVHNM
ncbi:MAG: excisionase [Bacillota bacterium]|nr:excisionase [Bacillota bacterium]